MGKYLKNNSKKKDSLIETAFDTNVPIFCPAFTDSSAGFGLVMHQEQNPKKHITIDSVREFRELTEIKIKSKGSGLFMICLLYTSPSPRDQRGSRMPSSA